jgi:hypothetical protein
MASEIDVFHVACHNFRFKSSLGHFNDKAFSILVSITLVRTSLVDGRLLCREFATKNYNE